MAQSMTAFARTEHSASIGTLIWEIRSVNHRYLEPHIRLPDTLRELESAVREQLRQHLSRGKLECTLRLTGTQQPAAMELNLQQARLVINAAGQLASLMQNPAPLNPLEVLQWPEVISSPETDSQTLQQLAMEQFGAALEQLKQHRSREGEELARLINERLDQIAEEVQTLTALIPEMLDNQKQKILARCAEMAVEMDSQRLEQELVLLAQRSDVAEELDRLNTHLQEVRRTLNSKGAMGRRLDFLMQELNREANTLGSKAIDIRTTQASVNIKVLIEQMREQVQNIE